MKQAPMMAEAIGRLAVNGMFVVLGGYLVYLATSNAPAGVAAGLAYAYLADIRDAIRLRR